MLALTECHFVMRCAEGSSTPKLCMAVHSADPLLYLQESHLPEHSREGGEAPVRTNTVNQRERGFHQLTDRVSLFWYFSFVSLPSPGQQPSRRAGQGAQALLAARMGALSWH